MRLRAKLEYTNIASHLLPHTFTFAKLEDLYARGARASRRTAAISGGGSWRCGSLLRLARERRGPHRLAALYSFRRRDLQAVEML